MIKINSTVVLKDGRKGKVIGILESGEYVLESDAGGQITYFKKDSVMKANKENIENLLKLIQENPGLEILPMVDSECVPSDDFSYWMGEWGSAEIDKYYCSDERVYFKGDDFEELVDDWIDNNYERYPRASDELIEERAAAEIESYDWVKAIIVKINNP
ncbi:MAG TPA: hypothetical protein GX707_06415 [Epulopiscium sp.]|nr:hypothetical protein [Candidatus Epulonipiscium sp.]